MGVTDPIADMLSVIRNAVSAHKQTAEVKNSKLNESILKILKEEKFINNYKILKDNKQGMLKVYLKYYADKAPAIIGLKKISKIGLRQYAGKDSIPTVLGGLGVSIISTSKGLLTGRQAREENIGGEIICSVW